ncbi:MAG TPA: TonB-dependent receptor [Sphingomicrobium sp.]|nr:TonB-dependent receptor [Sphingomicrobium sp.]
MGNSETRRWRDICATSSWSAIALVLSFGSSEALAQTAPAASSLAQTWSLTAPKVSVNKAWPQLASAAAGADAASAQPAATANQSGAPVPQTQPKSGQPASENEKAIVVVGARASQRSSINRKKAAETATDSIVADDIGSFPDRNIAEAMSRIPGVALSRNAFGEGDAITVRGNSGGLVRVEMDGVQVLSTTGVSLDPNAGRTSDFRELPAALVQSIDVVKGSTADMTEGGLGGTVQIHTRTGLDFKKPYFSIEADEQKNTLDNRWTPSFTAVATKKFFNDRLGILVTGVFDHVINESDEMQNTTSGNRGYARSFDFDNSPDKTFTYNLDTLGTDDADKKISNSQFTPRQILTMSNAAQTKADCFTEFPNLTSLQTSTASSAQNQRAERILEQQACLNQWNDYTPSLIRTFMNDQDEKRLSLDARADFRLTDNLTIYAKTTQANRKVDDQFRTFTPISLFNQNVAGSYDINFNTYPYQRSVSPTAPAGYYLYDPLYSVNNTGTSTDLATVNRNQPVLGNVLNVVPGGIVVDDKHNVTQMTLTNNTATIDQIGNVISTKTHYYQGGAEYRLGRFEASAMAALATQRTTRGDMRTARSYEYGDATLTLQPNGLWDIQLPSTYDQTNLANFVQLNPATCLAGQKIGAPNCLGQRQSNPTVDNPAGTPSYTVGQMPLTTSNYSVSYSPREGDTKEKLAKLDLTYHTQDLIPFLTRIKIGGEYRDDQVTTWAGTGTGGTTIQSAIGTYGQPGYVPPIVIPTANVRGSYRACEPTATSTQPCNYGFVQNTALGNSRSGVDTLTQQQLITLFQNTVEKGRENLTFFGDYPNKGDLPPAWIGIDVPLLFKQLGAWQFMNFDCLKVCTANNGQVYAQPFTHTDETTKNIYGMVDFSQDLPLGLIFDGNAGVRGVFTNVSGTGSMTIANIIPDPNNAGGTITQSFTQNTTLKGKSTDWLPSVNLNLWALHRTVVLRGYYGRTVSRPPVTDLIGGGTCTINETTADDPNNPFGCSGRVGNPALKPFTANSYNLSLEWYPTRDIMFSGAYGRLDVKIGNPIAVTKILTPFAGSTLTDPTTGQPLADVTFEVPTWDNGPGYKRAIWEFSTKSAFTFLPWFLRHTGVDANISILKTLVTQGIADPLTGDVMLPIDESKYFTNVSLWYDDGRLNARVSYQHRTGRFQCITPCGGNNIDFNYPGEGYTNVRLPYNPGVAQFIEPDTYIDAKITYNITHNIQVYVEGRNLTATALTYDAGPYEQFSNGTPKLMRLIYAGRRFLVGVRFQLGAPKESR